MKRKRLDRNTSWGFQYFPYYQMRIDHEQFHGKASVILLTDGKYQYWSLSKAGSVPVCGADMLWLQLIPDGKNRLITASCILKDRYETAVRSLSGEHVVLPVHGESCAKDECAKPYEENVDENATTVKAKRQPNKAEGSKSVSPCQYAVTCWYVDVTERLEEDADGVWAYIDKYLDVIVSPKGDVIVMDRDELLEAYRSGELTKEQYQSALSECDSIVEDMGRDIPATLTWTETILSVALEQIAHGLQPIEKSLFVAQYKDKVNEQIRAELFSLQDLGYKEFHSRLMPTIDEETIIGVRTPALRALARRLRQLPGVDLDQFKASLPHRYYEENNLHAFLIEKCRDYDTCIWELERFLPYVDNWATCDMMRPKCFSKHRAKLIKRIEGWLASGHVYTIRFGIEALMGEFLDEDYDISYPQMVAAVVSDEYYVNMMIAWYFATALSKQWESIIGYLTEQRLSLWVHNKTVQKAIESNRITPEQKEFLRTLRRK